MATHTNNVEWHKGRDAFNAGVGVLSNPYTARDGDDDSRHARWRKGWWDAKRAIQDTM